MPASIVPTDTIVPGHFVLYTSDDSQGVFYNTSLESPDIDAAFYDVDLSGTPFEWVSRGPRITRTRPDTFTLRTRVAMPVRIKEGVQVTPSQLPGQLDVLEERLMEKLRGLSGFSVFPGSVSIVPYDIMMNGPLDFWTSGEARMSRTRDVPNQDLHIPVAEDALGPGYEAGLTESQAAGGLDTRPTFGHLMMWVGITTMFGVVFWAIGQAYTLALTSHQSLMQIYGISPQGPIFRKGVTQRREDPRTLVKPL